MVIDSIAVGIDPRGKHHFAADRFLHAVSFSVEESDTSSAFVEFQQDSYHLANSLLVVPNPHRRGVLFRVYVRGL